MQNKRWLLKITQQICWNKQYVWQFVYFVSSVYSLVGLYKSCSAITLYEDDYRIKAFLKSDLSS